MYCELGFYCHLGVRTSPRALRPESEHQTRAGTTPSAGLDFILAPTDMSGHKHRSVGSAANSNGHRAMRLISLLVAGFLLGRPLLDVFGLVPAAAILGALAASVEVMLAAIESARTDARLRCAPARASQWSTAPPSRSSAPMQRAHFKALFGERDLDGGP